ncbi:Fic family protein [Spirosoma sp. KUDC1026]|nr:Fic family protein [Spirosoma sp. KUDC1026]
MDPVDLWSVIKENRTQNRRMVELAKELFYFTNTDFLQEALHLFDLNLGEQKIASDEEKQRYLIGSIMEESIASSQIEGAVTSRVAAKEMLRKDRAPRNKSERMIVNNYQTIQHIIAIKKEPLTPEALLNIHQLMVDQTMDNPDEAGQFRQHDDIHVVDAIESEVIHTPPSFSTLPDFIQDLCEFFNDETPGFFLHPVVKASIIHFLIGYFHPFTDGNGRTARALFYWYLLRKGYWLTEYLSISRVIKESRNQYYRAFQYTEADENDLTYFVVYQVKTLSKAYDELKKYIAHKNQEKQQQLALQRNEGLSPRQAEIVDWLQRDPNVTLSAKEVQIRLGVSNQTARFDIQALIEAGYLADFLINRKERRYVRGPRFDKQT